MQFLYDKTHLCLFSYEAQLFSELCFPAYKVVQFTGV